jgi:hypothetical protein
MDRGAYREFKVRGITRRDLTTLFEFAAHQKGFRISNRRISDDSTTISVKKGDFVKSASASILTDGISDYFQSSNAYGADAEISERGDHLRFYLLVVPRSGYHEQGDLLGMMDHPLLNLTMDPGSNKLLEDILTKMRAKGVVLEEISLSSERSAMQPGEKYIDDSGWIVHRGPELPSEPAKVPIIQIISLIFSIIGFLGCLMLITQMVDEPSFYDLFEIGIFCLSSILPFFGIPGAILAVYSLKKVEKGKRTLAIISLIFSLPSILLFMYLYLKDWAF